MPIGVRIEVFTMETAPQIGTMLAQIDKRGMSGREFLMRVAGPIVKAYLDSITHQVQSFVWRIYQLHNLGLQKPMKFLGGYERAVQRRYRAMTAQTWPWAYVGLYPQPGPDTFSARNPQIYIPSIEKGARPSSKFRARTPEILRQARHRPARWSGESRGMYERISFWAAYKMGFYPGTREHHDFVWHVFQKLLSQGTVGRQLFTQLPRYPEFKRMLVLRRIEMEDEVVLALKKAAITGQI